jgi:dinuclear metal center YbgI/SA1388 family protein
MAVPLTELVNELDGVLEPHKFKDYCPNGLQVQGREEVSLVVSGVTACQALIDAAVEEGADAILVHHGYFWRDEDACITGMKKRRLKALLDNNISLLAYHLPLDAHPEYGNNVSLARMLGIEIDGKLDPQDPVSVGNTGHLPQALPVEDFLSRIEQTLGRRPQHIGLAGAKIQSLGWCTGAAQGYIEQALTAGVDAYLTGEISEQTVHVAREEGIHFIAAGHHATERYGVQALGEYLSKKFSLQHRFIDIDNPV